ncbi:MAG: DUF5103 domain-containing protein, partial [Bacteroidales bacterium]
MKLNLLLLTLALCLIFFVGCGSSRQTPVVNRFTVQPEKKGGDALSTDNPYFNPDLVVMEDREYMPNIRAVKIYRQDVELSMPVLDLAAQDKLMLIFDDLDGFYKEYRYTIRHCDAYWNPSNLLTSEYIDGFSEGLIQDYAFSQATRQPYVHYQAFIPTEDMKITKSGNYIVLVYLAGDPSQVVLSRRFMIYESRVTVNARVKRSAVIEDQRFKQEIDFEIERGAYQVDNPYQDLIVIIQQNGRWDNAIRDLKPKLVTGSKLSYDWERINVFDGMNEYRHIDLRSLSRLTPRVHMIDRDSVWNHVYVKPDFKRGFQVYLEDKDLNGEYVISSDEALSNQYTEADYAWVHFTFPYQSPSDQGAIYLFGALTNWQFLPEAKMVYNATRNTYEASLYLKQGYYNYHYV